MSLDTTATTNNDESNLTLINDTYNNDHHSSSSSSSSTASSISDECVDKVKKARSVGVCTDTQDINLLEPGSNILLEGIIWNETNKGVLILNVSWRGKSFVGSLIDSNKAGWAPPR